MSLGHDRERQLRHVLEAAGWLCVRAAGSLGPVDVLAIARAGAMHPARAATPARQGEIALIECKSTAGGPYERFGPAERKLLAELAASVGASAWLAYKPKGARAWTWIPSAAWPATRVEVDLEGDAAAGEPTHNRANPPHLGRFG